MVAKRADGYHDLETCFVPVNWCDILEIIESTHTRFESSGISIPGDPESNLCLQAYHLLQDDYDLPPVHIYLHKLIPVGAGLGGGSADASFTLKLLNDLFELNLTPARLEQYAARLGSDCPFFIRNEPVLAYRTGNEFCPVNVNLKGTQVVLVHPEINISTREAYSGITPAKPDCPLKKILETVPVDEWNRNVKNDFEPGIFSAKPQLQDIKDQLYDVGAYYAAMSGSGSTIYGFFNSTPEYLPFPGNYTVKVLQVQ